MGGWWQISTQIIVFVVAWNNAYEDVSWFAGEEVDEINTYLRYFWYLIIAMWIVHGVQTGAKSYDLLSNIDYMSVRETQVS